MDQNNPNYRAVYYWVEDSLKQDYASRMRDPHAMFKYQSWDNGTLTFADGIRAFKQTVRQNGFVNGIGLKQRVENGFGAGELMQIKRLAEQKALEEKDAPAKESTSPLTVDERSILKSLMVDAQTGFYETTEEEFNILKRANSKSLSASDLATDAAKIFAKIPHEELREITFGDFSQIVRDVLKSRKIFDLYQDSVTAPDPKAKPKKEWLADVNKKAAKAGFVLVDKNTLEMLGVNLDLAVKHNPKDTPLQKAHEFYKELEKAVDESLAPEPVKHVRTNELSHDSTVVAAPEKEAAK